MNTKPTEIISLLMRNADHFLMSAVTALSNTSPESFQGRYDSVSFDELFSEDKKPQDADHRNSLIFVAAGVELLLKARLASVHWTQIFQDPGKAELKALSDHDFVSVGASELCDRVNRVTGREPDKAVAKSIFDARNTTIHFSPQPNNAIYVRVLVGLNFSLDFLAKELEPYLSGDDKEIASDLRERITRAAETLSGLKEKRLLLLEGELKSKGLAIQCPSCFQHALVLEPKEDTHACLFCFSKFVPWDLAAEYVSMFARSADELGDTRDVLTDCPDCDTETLVLDVRVLRRDNISGLCFNCCSTFSREDFLDCSSCGKLFSPNEDDQNSLCSDCWSNLDWS